MLILYGMYVFNTGFLVAAHGITIKNTGSGISFWIAFKLIRSSKFLSPVCKYDRHQESEFIRIPQNTLQVLKNSFHSARGTTIHDMCP